MMKRDCKLPKGVFDDDLLINLGEKMFSEQRTECGKLGENIYGVGLKYSEKFMFLYFKVRKKKVIGVCTIMNDGCLDDLPKFSLAYSVKPNYQGRGIAKSLASIAINHFKTRIKIKDVSRYYLVSYVSLDNPASQAVSRRFFGEPNRTVLDDHTNEMQWEYRMFIER